MKKILALVLIALPLLFARPVHAMEGTANLAPVPGSDATCFVASIYRGQYQAIGSCRNLPTAYSAERNRFFVWFQDEAGNWMPMGELDHGKFQFTSGTRFVAVEVTAEISPAPRQPSSFVLASGRMHELVFSGSTVTPTPVVSLPSGTVLTPTPTITGVVINPTPTPSAAPASALANILRTIGRVVAIGFIILLVIVVIMTIVTRRRGETV